MRDLSYDSSMRLRLLECWLPLAQQANQLYGWKYDAPSLEALIIAAAPRLMYAHNYLEAHVILWHYQVQHAQDNKPATGDI